MVLHQGEELLEPFFEFDFGFGVVFHVPLIHVLDLVVDFLDHGLPDVVLGIGVDWVELALDSVEEVLFLLGVDFLFLPEIDASNPFVLDFLEWRFGLCK